MDQTDWKAYDSKTDALCDAHGASWVRAHLAAAGDETSRRRRRMRYWLTLHDDKAADEQRAEALSFPREANDIARTALRRSAWSNGIAISALVVAAAALGKDFLK